MRCGKWLEIGLGDASHRIFPKKSVELIIYDKFDDGNWTLAEKPLPHPSASARRKKSRDEMGFQVFPGQILPGNPFRIKYGENIPDLAALSGFPAASLGKLLKKPL